MIRLNRKGFTLLEIIIVTGILALVASLAIPQLLRARLSSNESAVIGTLHTLSYGLESFRAVHPTTGYPGDLTGLAPAGELAFVSPILAVVALVRHGYNFTYTQVVGNPSTQYHIYAGPTGINVTGIRGFYIDEQGVVCAIPTAAGDPGHAPPGSVAPAGYTAVQ